VVDVLRETNQALNENRASHYTVPTDRQLVAQELLLFENSGSDDLENMVDSQLQTARLTLRLPWREAGDYTTVVDDIQQRVNAAFDGEAEGRVTGLMMIFARTLDAMMSSIAKSYTIAVFVITLMMVLLVGHIRLGLISMIPNLLPITIVLGVMGLWGLPLDAFTMLIGSIALGLAVDDTVHFMHNFQRYYRQTGDTVEAITHTLHTAGRAMVITTIVLSLGFLIFMRSEMNNLLNFGGLTGLAIVLALMADLLLAPALMTLIFGKGKREVYS
jgi:predicted RND superfamily exporter protein